jgi:hypothetical protein
LKRNKQFRMFRYFLNETKQPISHVSKQILSSNLKSRPNKPRIFFHWIWSW